MAFLVELLGDSPQIVGVRKRVEQLLSGRSHAQRLPTLLIHGETGTGKGLLARAIHRVGPRARGPFVDINCAAIPETLLEAELFGYERGAFTDAREAKAGLFQTAHRGTIFLDEIGLLSPALQAKLLKVLEEKTVRRLGSTRSESVDVWIISATNEDLTSALRQGRFREDLYFRLAVVTLALPPLRDRGGDIFLLAEHFLARVCEDYGLAPKTLGPDVPAILGTYQWPGNVRELSNIIERVALLVATSVISAADLGLPATPLPSPGMAAPAAAVPGHRSARDAVREQLAHVLTETGWNISRTAARLGLTRNTVRARIRKFGLGEETGTAVAGPVGPAVPDQSNAAPSAISLQASPVSADPGESLISVRWNRRRVALLRVARCQSGPSEAPDVDWSEPLKAIIDKVNSFGGAVEDVGLDSVEASFGLDPIENPSRRAAHAALAIRRELSRAVKFVFEPPVRMAIHTCEVTAIHTGDRPRMDRQSRRQVAELMDDLVGAAEPGAVVVTAVTAAFLRRRFVLAPAGQSVAGLDVHHLVAHGDLDFGPPEKSTRFVGRHDELALLGARLNAARGGRGQLVAVVGDAGVGKSRLVWEFTRSVEALGVRRLETASYAALTPYLPVIELLRHYFAIESDDDVEVVRERVITTVANRDASVKSSLPALLALLGVADSTWGALDPLERRRQVLDAVKHLMIAESRVQPLLMVFEDIHWSDSESQAVLDDLVAALPTARTLLVVTYRPEKRSDWGNLSYYTQVNLSPLPSESAHELLRDLLGTHPSLEPVKSQLIEWTNGHPFFLEEWVQALIETGVVSGARGAYWTTRIASAADVPATVEDVLATRIDRLEPPDKLLVQSAAAIGRRVSAAVLSAVVALPYDAVRAGMRRLLTAELVVEHTTESGPAFTFKHALTRDVAYRSLLPRDRLELHRRIVGVIEPMSSEGAPELIGELAHHAFQGELWAKAVEYLHRAGDHAIGSAAAVEAAEYFDKALQALERLDESRETLAEGVDLRIRRQDALWPPLQFAALYENLKQAEILAKGLRDERRQGWIACYLCRYFWAVGDLPAARAAGADAQAIAARIQNRALMAETTVYRGLVQESAGEYREAVATLLGTIPGLEEATTLASEEFPSRRFAQNGPVILRSFLMRALAQLGDFAAAIEAGEEALRMAEASRNPFAVVAARGGFGAVYVVKGEPDKAVELLEPGLRTCRAYGLHHWLPTLAGSLGAAYVRLGRIEEGLDRLREAVDRGAPQGLHAHASMWEMLLGEALLAAGHRNEAAVLAQRLLAQCRGRGERGVEGWVLLLLASIEAASAEPDRTLVRTRFDDAMAMADALGMRVLLARCRFGLGTYCDRIGARDEAAGHLGRAAEAFRALDVPWPAG